MRAGHVLVGIVIGLMAVAAAARETLEVDDAAQAPTDTESASVCLTGTFSGSLEGVVRLGAETFVVSDQTMIYVVGKGREKPGFEVQAAPVYVSARLQGAHRIATLIVVQETKSSWRTRLLGSSAKGSAGTGAGILTEEDN